MNGRPGTADGAHHLVERPRRLRRTPALRDLVAETRWHPGQLVLPLFVKEGIDEPAPIASMPGVVQHSLPSLRKAAREAVAAGVGGLMLFAVPEHKDATGYQALAPDGILQRALRETAAEVGDATVLMSDVCLDEFTDHGHCGVLTPDGRVDNDATLERYAAMAVLHADMRRPLCRPERHDGRSGGRGPQGPGRGRAPGGVDRGVHREVRLGLLRPVP